MSAQPHFRDAPPSADRRPATSDWARHASVATARDDSGWRKTLSGIALGAAGAASAASLGALAFYAYHDMQAGSALLLDPQSLQGLAEAGRPHIQASLRGMSRIHAFIGDVLREHGDRSTMGNVVQALRDMGGDPQAFVHAAQDQAQRMGGTQHLAWARRLSDPSTPLTPAAQAKVAEVIWANDRHAALAAGSAREALAFGRACVTAVAAACGTAVALNVHASLEVIANMRTAARRLAAIVGLIDDGTDRRLRRTIKAVASDPVAARATIASEFLERDSYANRVLSQHWMQANELGDRTLMLQLFAMERTVSGANTQVGQQVLVDKFTAQELRGLASGESMFGTTLQALSLRRDDLERRGLRESMPVDERGQPVPSQWPSRVEDLLADLQAPAPRRQASLRV